IFGVDETASERVVQRGEGRGSTIVLLDEPLKRVLRRVRCAHEMTGVAAAARHVDGLEEQLFERLRIAPARITFARVGGPRFGLDVAEPTLGLFAALRVSA